MCLCVAIDPLVYHHSVLQELTFKKNFCGHDNLLWQSGLSFSVLNPLNETN